MIEDGLRLVLSQPAQTEINLPTYGDPNGVVLVDILDKDALWDALEGPGE